MNWKDFAVKNNERMLNLARSNPGQMRAMRELDKPGEGKGALDAKTRELISLAVAVTTRCDGCIAVHVEAARKAGASRDELLEALNVAVLMNAGAAFVYSSRALDAFDQLSG